MFWFMYKTQKKTFTHSEGFSIICRIAGAVNVLWTPPAENCLALDPELITLWL